MADDEDAGATGPPPGEAEWSISRLLLRDLDKADFRDSGILKKGGAPTPKTLNVLWTPPLEASHRISRRRYPLFLEAAKAFRELPPGSQNQVSLMHAVAPTPISRLPRYYPTWHAGSVANRTRRETRVTWRCFVGYEIQSQVTRWKPLTSNYSWMRKPGENGEAETYLLSSSRR